MIAQGAVRIDGVPLTTETASRGDLVGTVLQVGKRRFVRLV
jgi:tyrosyl-tRNA synthetase